MQKGLAKNTLLSPGYAPHLQACHSTAGKSADFHLFPVPVYAVF